MEWGVVVEILRISNKNKSGTDLHRHSQLPTPNSKLPDSFPFIPADRTIANADGKEVETMERKEYEAPKVTRIEIDFEDRIIVAKCLLDGGSYCEITGPVDNS